MQRIPTPRGVQPRPGLGSRRLGRWAILGLLVGAAGGCGIDEPLALSSGACGSPQAEPGPGGCGLVCRAAVPVRFVEDNPQITVWIDDRPADLILDTGAGSTAITSAAVATLGLAAARPAPGNVYGIGGPQPRRLVDIGNLALGNIRTGPMTLDVSEYGKFPVPPAGALGADILHRYEVELDFPHNMLRLYEGHACPGNPPGWNSAGSVVPFGSDFAGRQPIVPVRLDGQTLQAVIDSGATTSGVSEGFARSAHVSEAELESELTTMAVGFGPDTSGGRMHQFRSLQIGTETLPKFEANVLDLRLHGIDMLLGDDYLRQRKVWISYQRREVRVTSDW